MRAGRRERQRPRRAAAGALARRAGSGRGPSAPGSAAASSTSKASLQQLASPPRRRSSAGAAKSAKATIADAGLPGRPRTSVRVAPRRHQGLAGLHRHRVEEGLAAEPREDALEVVVVAGRDPATGQQQVVARARPRRGRRAARGRRARCRGCRRRGRAGRRRRPGSRCASRAARPGGGVASGATTSSPVVSTATRGGRWTASASIPWLASSESAAGPRRAPAGSSSAPAATTSARRRIAAPAGGAAPARRIAPAFLPGRLERDHPVGAERHRRAGHHARRGARREAGPGGRAGRDREVDRQAGAGRQIAGEGEAVERRDVRRRQIGARGDRLGGPGPERRAARDSDCGQRREPGLEAAPGCVDGEHAAVLQRRAPRRNRHPAWDSIAASRHSMGLGERPPHYRGDLRQTALPEMLAIIHRTRVAGVIEASVGDFSKRVWLEGGYVVHASSSDLADSLGGFLRRDRPPQRRPVPGRHAAPLEGVGPPPRRDPDRAGRALAGAGLPGDPRARRGDRLEPLLLGGGRPSPSASGTSSSPTRSASRSRCAR